MARRDRQAAEPAAAVPAALALPAELTIYTVGTLHAAWRAWVEQLPAAEGGGAAADIEAGAVDQVDAAGLQLLLSLQHTLAGRGRACRLHHAGAVLEEGCAALGLADWLARHRADAEAAA